MVADETCKLILLGNGSVGKSSIIARFVDDGFTRVYKQTVGLDFFEKRLTVRGEDRLLLQVWDIGGQSISSKMLGKYIFGANVIMLCYDVTDPASFADLEDWYALVERTFVDKITGKVPKLPDVYLIGNKIDLMHLRQVQTVQHDGYIRKRNLMGGFLLSAQSGDNVLKSFYKVAAKAIGIQLTEYELSFMNKVVKASVVKGGDEGRTTFADEIEEQDRLDQLKRDQKSCCIIL